LYTAVLHSTAAYTAALQQVIHEYCTVHSSTALYSNVHSSITTSNTWVLYSTQLDCYHQMYNKYTALSKTLRRLNVHIQRD